MINELTTTFHGLEVEDFDPDAGIQDPRRAYRIRIDWDMKEADITFEQVFTKLRWHPLAGEITALIIGDWGGAAEGADLDTVINCLIAAKHQLGKLKALFIGEMVSEECEISWIHLGDLEPLWKAYPNLDELRVRGTEELSLGQLRLPRLRRLTLETGGLPLRILQEVCRADLPALEHLELWLGDDGYGWDGSVADLRPILSGLLFPKLKYLGLRNSCVADEVAREVANAPILGRIETLDLSLGTLGDEGVGALAASPLAGKLKTLDIHFHYASDAALARLRALGIHVDDSDKREPDEWNGEKHRYVSVSE